MDPVTFNALLTVGGLIVGWVVRHYFGAAAAPTTPAVPSPTGHPVLDAIRAMLHGANAQTAPALLAALQAILAASPPTKQGERGV
jgi:hypothetical protein